MSCSTDRTEKSDKFEKSDKPEKPEKKEEKCQPPGPNVDPFGTSICKTKAARWGGGERA